MEVAAPHGDMDVDNKCVWREVGVSYNLNTVHVVLGRRVGCTTRSTACTLRCAKGAGRELSGLGAVQGEA